MATYEFVGSDGNTYEFEADDENEGLVNETVELPAIDRDMSKDVLKAPKEGIDWSGSISEGLSSIFDIPGAAAKGFSQAMTPRNPFLREDGSTYSLSDAVDSFANTDVEGALDETVRQGARIIPGAGAAADALVDYKNDELGPTSEYANTAIRETVPALGVMGIAKGLQSVPNIGSPKQRQLKIASQREDAVTDSLGATKRTTDSEIAYGDNIAKYEDKFIERSGISKLDPSDPNALRTLGDNLQKLKDEGMTAKSEILKQADELGSREIESWRSTGTTKVPETKVYKPSDISTRISEIDEILRQEGAYDAGTKANVVRTPSEVPDVKALKAEQLALRKELDGILEPLGLREAYGEANANYATGVRFEDLINRTRGETGQAFAPPQARSLVDGVNGQIPETGTRALANKALDVVGGGREARTFKAANQREGNVIRNAQDIIKYRDGADVPSVTGQTARGVGQAIDPPANVGGIAEIAGLPGYVDPFPLGLPRQTESLNVEVFVPEVIKRTQGNPMALELLGKMQQAVSAGDRFAVEQMHENLTRAFPGVFERGYGVNGRVYSLAEQNRYMQRLRGLRAEGRVSHKIIAQQQNAFNDKGNLKLIPLDGILDVDEKALLRESKGRNKSRAQNPDGSYSPTY